MDSSTVELGLTRLWYLVGDWQGSGQGEDFQACASARFEWTLDDHFVAGFCQLRDAGSEQVLSTEHIYLYYDRDESGLLGVLFADDGLVEYAKGQVEPNGKLTLTSLRLTCVPGSFPRTQLRRVFQQLDKDNWLYQLDIDDGHGLLPYVTLHMQRERPSAGPPPGA